MKFPHPVVVVLGSGLLCASPALAEVCDKIDPGWQPGDLAVPDSLLIAVSAVIGGSGGALAGIGRTAWLMLLGLPLGVLVTRDSGEDTVIRLARAEGCVASLSSEAIMVFIATAVPALLCLSLARRRIRR